jgi:hypothetical protein
MTLSVDDVRAHDSIIFINRLISCKQGKDCRRILYRIGVCWNHPTPRRHIAIHSSRQGINGLCAIDNILKIFLFLLRISTLKPVKVGLNTSIRFFLIDVGSDYGLLIMFDFKLAILLNFYRHLCIVYILFWRSLSWIVWLPHRTANFVFNCFFIIDLERIIWFILS